VNRSDQSAVNFDVPMSISSVTFQMLFSTISPTAYDQNRRCTQGEFFLGEEGENREGSKPQIYVKLVLKSRSYK